jgi:hypothetical protein
VQLRQDGWAELSLLTDFTGVAFTVPIGIDSAGRIAVFGSNLGNPRVFVLFPR